MGECPRAVWSWGPSWQDRGFPIRCVSRVGRYKTSQIPSRASADGFAKPGFGCADPSSDEAVHGVRDAAGEGGVVAVGAGGVALKFAGFEKGLLPKGELLVGVATDVKKLNVSLPRLIRRSGQPPSACSLSSLEVSFSTTSVVRHGKHSGRYAGVGEANFLR